MAFQGPTGLWLLVVGIVPCGGLVARCRSVAGACLLLALLLGAGNAAGEAAGRKGSCTSSLLTGEPVSLSGIVGNRNRLGTRSRRLFRMREASLIHGDKRCAAGDVLARVRSSDSLPAVGSRVVVEGEWMGFETGSGLVTGVLAGVRSVATRPLPLRLRGAVADRIERRLPADVVPTALALLLAERDEMDPDVRRRYASAGMAHLLAVSGMHVGMLALGLTCCLRALSPGRRRTVTLLLLVGYVLMIGAPVAASRALLLLAGAMWAANRGWPPRSGELVGLAGILVLLHDPAGLLEPSFQLSFAGVSGVLVGLRLGTGGSVQVRAFKASACALLATSPFTAWHFGQVTPIGLFSHFAANPLVAACLAGLVTTIILPGPLSPLGGDVATGSIRLLDAMAGWLADVPMGSAGVVRPGVVGWTVSGLLCWSAYRLLRGARTRATLVPLLLAFSVLLFGPSLLATRARHALLCTLSVGQGDAAVLRTLRGHWMVFDGGPAFRSRDAGSAIVAPFLRRHGARRIDLAILSHPDLDHVGGLIGLLKSMEVSRVVDSGYPVPSFAYERFLARVDAAGSRWLPAVAGDSLALDGVSIQVLGPAGSAPGTTADANATSVVFRVEFVGGFRYLNTGDATSREELHLLERWPMESIRADLLKVGHHGSKTSSAVPFVSTVSPSVAVVSVGAGNRYGHPHPEALARLDSAGVPRIWRTDRHGTMCVEIDGGGRWRIKGERDWRDPAVPSTLRHQSDRRNTR